VKQQLVLQQEFCEESGESKQMECDVLTDSWQTVEESSWQNVEESSGHSDPEPTDVKVGGTDRKWTQCRRQQ
jgi:hypothetical protein